MGKSNPKRKGNLGKKKQKTQTKYDSLIKGVTDSDVEKFHCRIRSDKELDDIGFPNVRVTLPPLRALGGIGSIKGKWSRDWERLRKDREKHLNFTYLRLSEEEQKEERALIAEQIRILSRQLKWKKYRYATKNWEDDSGSDVGGEEDDGEEVEAWGEDSGSDVGSEEDIGAGEEAASASSGGFVSEQETRELNVEDISSMNLGREEEFEGIPHRPTAAKEDFGEEVEAWEEEDIGAGEEAASASGGGFVSEQETRELNVEDISSMNLGREEEFGGIPRRPTAANPLMFRFPHFEDNDIVSQYQNPFSLLDWFNSHSSADLRYLRYVGNDLNWNVENWSGDRLKRESLGIIQSVLSAVLDYHERHGPHRNIEDHANVMFRQYVVSVGGSQKIQYHVELPGPKIKSEESSDLLGLSQDMLQVKLIFLKVLEGRDIDSEMTILLDSLMGSYPFDEKDAWKNKLLRNCPTMWDGKARANFVVDFYYNWHSDSEKHNNLDKALLSVGSLMHLPGFQKRNWIRKIPNPSTFFEILTYSEKEPENELTKVPETQLPPANAPKNPPSNAPTNPPKPQYVETKISDVLRYIRVALHHHRQTKGAGCKDINYIELCLSSLFRCFTVGLYMGMCRYNVFFN